MMQVSAVLSSRSAVGQNGTGIDAEVEAKREAQAQVRTITKSTGVGLRTLSLLTY